MVEVVLALCTGFGVLFGSGALPSGWDACVQPRKQPPACPQTDWVEYYGSQGSHINVLPYPTYAPMGGAGVTPTMQWAVPNSCLTGPPCASAACPPYATPADAQPAARRSP